HPVSGAGCQHARITSACGARHNGGNGPAFAHRARGRRGDLLAGDADDGRGAPVVRARDDRSPQRMTVVLAAEAAPLALLALASGRIATRLGARRTMLVCDAL